MNKNQWITTKSLETIVLEKVMSISIMKNMKDQLSRDLLSLNSGSSAKIDPNVNSRGSIVSGSIVGDQLLGNKM